MEPAEPQNVALPEEHLQPYERGKNSGKPLDLRTSRLLRELELFTYNIPVENPVETVLSMAVDKGILPEHARGMNDGVEIVPTRRGYYFVDTTRKNDAPKLKTEELYSNLLKGVEELFDYVELGAVSKQWDDVKAQKAYVEKLERARNSWLGDRKKAPDHPSRLDRLRKEEMRTIKEISKYGRPFVYVSPLGAAWIDEQLAKEKLPKAAAALKYLAPHGTGDAKSLATHVCGMVGDLYSGKMPDFNPTLLGGEIWNNLLMELGPETTAKKSLGKKLAYAGIIALLFGAGLYTAHRMINDTPRNRFMDSAKATGASADEAGRIYDGIYKAAMSDRQITIDRNHVVADTAQRLLDTNIVTKHPNLATLRTLGNFSVAEDQLGLKVDKATASYMTNATEANQDVVDFSQIKSDSIDSSGSHVTPVPARDTYLTAIHLKSILDSGFDIVKHPEMLTGINVKVIENAYNIFSDPYGISHYESVTPSSKGVLDIMQFQWDLYSEFAPQKGGGNMTWNRLTPWYNATALKALYPDKNAMRQALLGLFKMDSYTIDKETGNPVTGLAAAKTSMLQAYNEFKYVADRHDKVVIDESYAASLPNIALPGALSLDEYKSHIKVLKGEPTEDDLLARWSYWQWEGDRGYWGLPETVARYRAVENALEKSTEYWRLVREIVGYERMRGSFKMSEPQVISYLTPAVLRMAGFPTGGISIDPSPAGNPGAEWAVSLPPHIIKGAIESSHVTDVYLGPAYEFGFYSCAKDNVKTINSWIGGLEARLKK